MKNFLLATLLFGLAIGCKKDNGGSSCGDSIGKAISTMTEKVKGRMGGDPAAMTERMDKLKTALVTRCTEDKWPDAVVHCFDTAAGRPDMRKCQEQLPPDLKMAVEADITKLMVGSMGGRHGGSGMMGHGDDDGMRKAHDGSADPGAGSAAAGSAGSAAAAPAGSATP